MCQRGHVSREEVGWTRRSSTPSLPQSTCARATDRDLIISLKKRVVSQFFVFLSGSLFESCRNVWLLWCPKILSNNFCHGFAQTQTTPTTKLLSKHKPRRAGKIQVEDCLITSIASRMKIGSFTTWSNSKNILQGIKV